MEINKLLDLLNEMGDKKSLPFMAKYGINAENALGIKIPALRKLSCQIGKNHQLAIQLWAENYHEGKILASMLASPSESTPQLMDLWNKSFNSWDLCDQCCMNLFEKTAFAWGKAVDWCNREPEFEKRAGYVLISRLAVSDKNAPDEKFEQFYPLLLTGSTDQRNFVKKAVNWAIRQIGKRNVLLNKKMIELSLQLLGTDNSTARWIATDAMRELKSDAVQNRLRKKENKNLLVKQFAE